MLSGPENDDRPLDQRLSGLATSPFPAWVLEPEAMRILWANDAALELWRAESREELLARDFSATSAAMRTRLHAAIERARAGEQFWDDWTFFPRRKPVQVKMFSMPFRLDDGRFGILQHVQLPSEGPGPEQLRGIVALTHSPVIVALVEPSGAVLMKNPAAISAFGLAAVDFRLFWLDEGAADAMLRAAERGEVTRRELLAKTSAGERWFAVEVRPIHDPVTGSVVALVHGTDETARRGAEADVDHHKQIINDLRLSLETVEQQRREIVALSAPILDVAERTLAVPLIGALDAERGAEITERLLNAIRARRTRTVILDLTGLAIFDPSVAAFLDRVVRAIELLGARPMITGVRPALARMLIESEARIDGVPVFRSLAEGVRRANQGSAT